jgi:hypothetical protein
MAGNQYTIGTSTRRCAATERELATGDRFVAALVQRPDAEQYERIDFCEDAWERGARPARGLVLYGFWRGVVPDPTAKKKLLIDDQSLLELFEQSGEETAGEGNGPEEKDRLAFRFVLALILLRKRLLVQEGSRKRNMLVRARGTPRPPEGPELMEVADPGLDDVAVARVTQMLGAVISGDVQNASGPAAGGTSPTEKGG